MSLLPDSYLSKILWKKYSTDLIIAYNLSIEDDCLNSVHSILLSEKYIIVDELKYHIIDRLGGKYVYKTISGYSYISYFIRSREFYLGYVSPWFYILESLCIGEEDPYPIAIEYIYIIKFWTHYNLRGISILSYGVFSGYFIDEYSCLGTCRWEKSDDFLITFDYIEAPIYTYIYDFWSRIAQYWRLGRKTIQSRFMFIDLPFFFIPQIDISIKCIDTISLFPSFLPRDIDIGYISILSRSYDSIRLCKDIEIPIFEYAVVSSYFTWGIRFYLGSSITYSIVSNSSPRSDNKEFFFTFIYSYRGIFFWIKWDQRYLIAQVDRLYVIYFSFHRFYFVSEFLDIFCIELFVIEVCEYFFCIFDACIECCRIGCHFLTWFYESIRLYDLVFSIFCLGACDTEKRTD